MKNQAEVIAMLMPEGEGGSRASRMATLLVRNPDGRMSLETVRSDRALDQYAMNTGCFRRGTPIIDPVTRQVFGYEMEVVEDPRAELA